MAASKSGGNTRAAARRTSSKKASATDTEQNDPAALTDEQEKVASAKKATSKTETGKAQAVGEKKIRMESEGVLTPIKSDFDNPESPVVGDPSGALVGPADPGKVKLGAGETAAQHEAHVLLNAPQMIAERIEKESGPEGLPTDVIAREQQARVARTEFQRVEGNVNIGDSEQETRLREQDGTNVSDGK